jgi:multidrug efflux system outer membrane protein
MNRLAVMMLALSLAGCAVGPNYRPPQTATPAAWSVAASDTVAPVVRWWQTFNDPQLDSLIERAVQANHDLRIATARVREARALRGFAQWDFGPSIAGGASYTDARVSKNALTFPIPKRDTDTYDAGFDASWEMDVFGGKRRALEAANADVAASEEDRRDVLVSLLAEVARNYVEVRGFQGRLAIARHNIASQQAALDLTRRRFNAGASSDLDVSRAAALLAGTQSQLPALEVGLKQALHRLAVLIGEPPGAFALDGAPIPVSPPEVPVGLPSDLLRRRPDVRRAERELAGATARIGVQTAELFPKFSLVGAAGLQSLSASDWFTGGSRYWSAGPTVTWRIFDFGRIRSQIQAANAREQAALAAYEKAVLVSLEDVENALVAYAKEQERYRWLQEQVKANRRAVDLANQLYTSGASDFLNVLDAQRSLYQAEDDLAQSERTVAANLIALYKALGGGWEDRLAEAGRDRSAAPPAGKLPSGA